MPKAGAASSLESESETQRGILGQGSSGREWWDGSRSRASPHMPPQPTTQDVSKAELLTAQACGASMASRAAICSAGSRQHLVRDGMGSWSAVTGSR